MVNVFERAVSYLNNTYLLITKLEIYVEKNNIVAIKSDSNCNVYRRETKHAQFRSRPSEPMFVKLQLIKLS